MAIKNKKIVEDCSHDDRKKHTKYCYECIKSNNLKNNKKYNK